MQINRNDNSIKPESLRVVFMGTPDFAVPSLMTLIKENYQVVCVVTQPDKPQGRHMVLTPSSVKAAAIVNGIPVIQPESVRTSEFAVLMQDIKPDLIVTAAYGKILPARILEIPIYGCINVHGSLLPAYRGAAPVQWSILNGDKTTGVTVMLMDEGMDTGDIIAQASVDIPIEMNSRQLMDILAGTGASILSKTIIDYCSGKITPVPQDEKLASTVRLITKDDGLINWSAPAYSIHNRIRACNPWPVAFTYYQGKRMKIYSAGIIKEFSTISHQEHTEYPAGSIIKSEDKKRLLVVCRDGVIEILELQMDGGKRLPAHECAHNFASLAVLGEVCE
ncbi:MAG: methionyl-tRNA formyltransferase [Saccharofermentanales bacterium]